MLERVRAWFLPHRTAALKALLKAAILLGAISELTWLLNTKYFSLRFTQLPLSLAWSMLAMIGAIMYIQVGVSLLLKLRSARLRKISKRAKGTLEALLAGFISGGNCQQDIARFAKKAPVDFEICVTAALLGTRGAALFRLRQLPDLNRLCARWTDYSRKGDDEQRRRAVEQLGLLREPSVTATLEAALEDKCAGVVAAAIRGLLRLPSYERRDELVRSLPARPYLVRVLTACEAADDAARLAAPVGNIELMELAEARGRTIGAGDLRPLLDHRDVRTRRSALRLSPLASPNASPAKGAVMAALRHKELEMRAAAVGVAARLRMAGAAPSIAEYARESGSSETARASCVALAALGPMGRDLLHLMSALGEAGEAPAEALGEALAASAKGGRA